MVYETVYIWLSDVQKKCQMYRIVIVEGKEPSKLRRGFLIFDTVFALFLRRDSA
jgi:hypothetical protein